MGWKADLANNQRMSASGHFRPRLLYPRTVASGGPGGCSERAARPCQRRGDAWHLQPSHQRCRGGRSQCGGQPLIERAQSPLVARRAQFAPNLVQGGLHSLNVSLAFLNNCGISTVGEVAEWSIAPHSKCGIRATVSGVRIPPSPPAPSFVLRRHPSPTSTKHLILLGYNSLFRLNTFVIRHQNLNHRMGYICGYGGDGAWRAQQND